jgi:hypothetical protein
MEPSKANNDFGVSMKNQITYLPGNIATARTSPAVDVSGYEIFNQGPSGKAHALAHQLTDTAQWQRGRHLLGSWLDSQSGEGSDWIHLQFHMAIFELALNDWDSAHRRFLRGILPAAASTAQALTDAPALLWRLALSAPATVKLPWQPIRRTALAHLYETNNPFVQLHHLMALAGARDTDSIALWLGKIPAFSTAGEQWILKRFAQAMLALSRDECATATNRLHRILPGLPLIGGSRAQNQLFDRLAIWTASQAGNASCASVQRRAA